MKYKVGQKVTMKELSPRYVNSDMRKYAGKVVTIAKIHDDGSFFITEDGWHWI